MALISKQFSDIVTFTRSSGGGRFNASGVYEWLATNQPRFDYDPVTLSPKGLLVEEQRTNTYTTGTGTPYKLSYNPNNATLAIPYAAVSPSGVWDATVLENRSATTSTINFAATTPLVATGVILTQSIYVKIMTWTSSFQIYFGNGASTGGGAAVYTYSGGVLSTVSAGASVVQLANGWHRLVFTYTTTADVNGNFTISASAGTKYAVWGGQVEQASFATSHIPQALTFANRSSTATYFDSNGVMQTAAINVARTNYIYNGSAWVSQGLFIEEARTNLLTYSAGFDSWAQTGISFGINALAAPDGTTTADKLTETATTEIHRLAKIVPVSINTTYVASVYAKAGELRYFGMKTGVAESPTNVVFDLVSGTIVSGAASGMTITPAGNGWYRCAVTFTPTSSTQAIMYWTLLNETNFTNESRLGDGVSGLYVWGAQLEQGLHASSYIPTTTAQVTRAADVVTTAQATRSADVASVNVLSPWYRADEGTLYIEFSHFGTTLSSAVGVSDGTVNNRVLIRPFNTDLNVKVVVGGVSYADNTRGSSPLSTLRKYAAAMNGTSVKLYNAGTGQVSDTIPSMPVVTKLHIGTDQQSTGQINGHISSIKYYPRRLADAELQALTT